MTGLPQGCAVRPVPPAQKADVCEGDKCSSMASSNEQLSSSPVECGMCVIPAALPPTRTTRLA